MPDLVVVAWYATSLRKTKFAAEVVAAAPIALRYGATEYRVHVSDDDRYKITQMTWIASKEDWYRYWDGPEMIEFRARNIGPLPDPDHLRLGRRDRRRGARAAGAEARTRARARAADPPGRGLRPGHSKAERARSASSSQKRASGSSSASPNSSRSRPSR